MLHFHCQLTGILHAAHTSYRQGKVEQEPKDMLPYPPEMSIILTLLALRFSIKRVSTSSVWILTAIDFFFGILHCQQEATWQFLLK
jgi:hypothetical protein